jgi:hypothetical protein
MAALVRADSSVTGYARAVNGSSTLRAHPEASSEPANPRAKRAAAGINPFGDEAGWLADSFENWE